MIRTDLITITDLRTKGYKPLKKGCIHYRCPGCGYKASNEPRRKDAPKNAFLAEYYCIICKVPYPQMIDYHDENGWFIDCRIHE